MSHLKPLQVAVPVLFLMAAAAQGPAQAPPASNNPPTSDAPEFGLKTEVTNIVAPVLVTDRSGNIIDGLEGHQFHLYDNKREQNIQVDVAFEPLSVVVLIEAAARVESILPQVKHLGSLLDRKSVV